MKHRFATLTALSAVAVLTLSACGSSSGGDTEGIDMGTESPAAAVPSSSASAESSMEATSSASAEAMAEHNDADVMFAQMMLPHHRQAVEMSDMLLDKENIDPAVTDLATQIKEAQDPEIEELTGWLEAWGEPMEMTEEGMESMQSMEGMDSEMGSMDGMMSDEDMTSLDAAEGTEAETMFLESMTAHHRGAIEMAQTEIEDGMFPDAVEMAETIVETQQAEIDEMSTLLEQK
ncbi:DUF305 domain-containing protein [Arthrobacter echini]|uniref:DUF305 domain-containing protein n=2 Tax=Arthrobacter echini TaxID=1529066 RepID=A0A4S5E0H3_9MICC|nr:DUF305 domain-containing protein [Arthrobacter echini]THJ64806.1 DUF305 domain-containing protein [Arthrobacter echini]TYC97135.1 DUF305 domain-containing protein [Arthrobacter echini]